MDKKGYQNAMDYFEKIGEMFNEDEKYVYKAEKVEPISEVDTEINTDLNVYEIQYRVYLKDDDFADGSRRKAQKILRNHFGSWFSLLEGGSQNISVHSIDGDTCKVAVRYCTEEVIFTN